MSNAVASVRGVKPSAQVLEIFQAQDPKVNKEFLEFLDRVTSQEVSNPQEREAVLAQLKEVFPQEIRGRLSIGVTKVTEDRKFARENPDALFACGLAHNPNYEVRYEDRKFARENPNTWFVYGLAQNPNYEVRYEDREFARENPDTSFAVGLAQNPNYD